MKKYRMLEVGEIILSTDKFTWCINFDINADNHWNPLFINDPSIGRRWIKGIICPMRREVVSTHPADVF